MQDAISSPAASATHPAPRSRAMSPPPRPPFALVDIQGLRKRYGDNEVLKGIDLRIGRREVVTIIGRSGSGKSTLLRCVNGSRPSSRAGWPSTASRCGTTMPRRCARCARTSA